MLFRPITLAFLCFIIQPVLLTKQVNFSGNIPRKKNIIYEVAQVYTPTVLSKNHKCRQHTEFYLEELKKYKLWAVQMFDASSKFPSGIVSGSMYHLGNFDECLAIKVPFGEEEFVGKYCLAEFKISPKHNVVSRSSYEIDNDHNSYNISIWQFIDAYGRDKFKGPRDSIHFSFCLPSSCSAEHLEESIIAQIDKKIILDDFNISVNVNPKNCQILEPYNLTAGDIAFLTVIFILFFLTILATLYHLLTRLDDLRKYQFSARVHKIIKCFSLRCNLRKLASTAKSEEGLECVHGIKVISMALIIMGHRVMFTVGAPILNASYIESFYKKIDATVLLNGTIITDTFFCISGFLATYLILSELEKGLRPYQLLILYVHRILRILPCYALILAFYCTLLIHTGSGPLWQERVAVEQQRCQASWWLNILFINNYVTDQICMFQSWFLTCDMHFFFMTPLIAWLLWTKPKLGVSLSVFFIALSTILLFVKVLGREEGILLVYAKLLRDPVINETFKEVYIPSHLRASPYFIGVLTGYLKFRIRSSGYKIPKYGVYLGWIFSVILIETSVYLGFLYYLPQTADNKFLAIYSALHHVTFSACIAWFIIAISCGYGAWVTPIVCWKPLFLLSRLTYATFLCHAAVQLLTVGLLRHSTNASVFNLMTAVASDIALSYVAGFLLNQFLECPLLNLEKILLGREKSKNSRRELVRVLSSTESGLEDNKEFSKNRGCYTINVTSNGITNEGFHNKNI